jgi:hypothetical protein
MNSMPSALASRGDLISTSFPSILTGTGVSRDGAAQDLHQRRLSRTILSNQRNDLTGLYVKCDVVQRNDARKAFANVE